MSLGDTVSPEVAILVNTPKDLEFPSGRILDANATDANVTVRWFHSHVGIPPSHSLAFTNPNERRSVVII